MHCTWRSAIRTVDPVAHSCVPLTKWSHYRSSEGSSDEEGAEEKKKGVEGLIEIENPNRAAPKAKKTTEALDTEKAPELSRREREEIQKQKARAHYEKMHAAGRTDQVSFYEAGSQCPEPCRFDSELIYRRSR